MLKDGEYLVDCPGLNEVEFMQDAFRMSLLNEIVTQAKSVCLCIVLKGSQIEEDHGSRYLRFMMKVLRMLTLEGVNKSDLTILPLINRAIYFGSLEHLEQKLMEPIKRLEQHIEALKFDAEEIGEAA